jgi:hypothetical protein
LVCGVAMGLITTKDDEGAIKDYKILTDLSVRWDFFCKTNL